VKRIQTSPRKSLSGSGVDDLKTVHDASHFEVVSIMV